MTRYAQTDDGKTIAYLEVNDIVDMATGTPFYPEQSVDVIAMTKNAGERLDDLAGAGLGVDYIREEEE